MALPFGLSASDRDVGAGRVDVDCGGGPGPQEFVVDRSDTAADVEDGLPVDTPRSERVDQRASQARRALLSVRAQFLGRVAGVELAIERGVAG